MKEKGLFVKLKERPLSFVQVKENLVKLVADVLDIFTQLLNKSLLKVGQALLAFKAFRIEELKSALNLGERQGDMVEQVVSCVFDCANGFVDFVPL